MYLLTPETVIHGKEKFSRKRLPQGSWDGIIQVGSMYYKGLIQGREKQAHQYQCSLSFGDTWPWAKECGQPLGTRKGKETNSSWEPVEAAQPCQHLHSSAGRDPFPTPDSQHWEIVHLCYLKLPRLWWFDAAVIGNKYNRVCVSVCLHTYTHIHKQWHKRNKVLHHQGSSFPPWGQYCLCCECRHWSTGTRMISGFDYCTTSCSQLNAYHIVGSY